MNPQSEYFRANVGAVITDGTGRVLGFQRRSGEGEWQMPQGGLEPGEAPRTAVYREIEEETALPSAALMLRDEIDEWLGYELPVSFRSAKTGRGQVQKWFAFRFVGSEQEIRPDGEEFSSWRWLTPTELLAACAAFRRPVYARVFERFAPLLAQR